MDRRADRAKIFGLVRGMLRRNLLRRGRLGRRRAGDDGAACQLFEMDVSERKDKLQRHRRERQPIPAPPTGPNPTHLAARDIPRGSIADLIAGKCDQFENLPGQA